MPHSIPPSHLLSQKVYLISAMIEGNDILGLTTPLPFASATPLSQQALRDGLATTLKGTSHIYTTFRIAQLISCFKRKVKTRVLSHAANRTLNARVEDDVREEFEVEVLKVIANDRVHRAPGRNRYRAGTKDTAVPCAERLLDELDSRLSRKGCLVSELASDDRLFLTGRYKFDFSNGVQKATELLALTESLLGTLKPTLPGGFADGKVECEEGTVVSDQTFVANLEHVLLCLYQDLLCFLLVDNAWSKVLEHIFECQEEQSRRRLEWFFEFPDARHPLSTTWPWSIRPSLVILWGVCWMFYYFDMMGNLRKLATGEILVPAEDLGIDAAPQGSSSGTNRQAQISATLSPQPHYYLEESPVNLASSTRLLSGLETATPHQAATTEDDERTRATENIIRTGYAPLFTQPRNTRQNANRRSYWSSVNATPTFSAGAAISTVGAIITTANASERLGRQPHLIQDQSADSSLYSYQSHLCNQEDPFAFSPFTRTPTHTMTAFTTVQDYAKSATASPSKTLSTPERSKSPEAATRSPIKREESTISPTNIQPSRPHPRGTPRTTEGGKFACENCHQIFDRKCEWNKHMDKHERPYKCDKSQCAKLLGFTYSGGLLRHEREVHGMHGGPKEQLHCPIRHCKRHTEQGFTRRENLQEHLRRVHKLSDVSVLDVVDEDAPTPAASEASEMSGTKRKRLSVVSQGEETHDDNLRGQLKRLKHQHSELQRMCESQRDEISEIRRELREMRSVKLPPVKLVQHERSQDG